MENKHRRRCSTSLVIREIRIKITIRGTCRSSRMVTIPSSRTSIPSVGENEGKFVYAYTDGGNENGMIALDNTLTLS